MGFFDFLAGGRGKKRTNVEVVPDKIWMNTDAKLAGLAKEVAERSRCETAAILLVAHFSDTLARLEGVADEVTSSVPVKAVLASQLKADLAASLHLDASAVIDVIVGERHPLRSVDDRLEAFAEDLPCRGRLSHHVALDDPVMQIFTGVWVKSVLGKLGMTEDESIESEMVRRRIRQAQQKIGRRVRSPVDAASAVQWFALNCPELARR